MFFKNISLMIFIKFLWAGLIFGVISVVLKTIAKLCKKNVFIVNILSFIFWFSITVIYLLMCMMFNNYSFSGIGVFGIFLGLIIIKISIDFFFDYFIRFIYNEFILRRRKSKNGKIQANEEI